MFSDVLGFIPTLLPGVIVTVKLSFFAGFLGILCAFVAGLARFHRWWMVRSTAKVYIEVFRGTSALIQLFWFFFVLPFWGIDLSPFNTGVIVLGLNAGAYGAEVVRGAISKVDPLQSQAAHALHFSRRQALFRIVFPQALPIMVPSLGNVLVELLKGTALVSLITLNELTFSAQILRSNTMKTAEIFTVVMVMYFVIALFISFFARIVEARLKRPYQSVSL